MHRELHNLSVFAVRLPCSEKCTFSSQLNSGGCKFSPKRLPSLPPSEKYSHKTRARILLHLALAAGGVEFTELFSSSEQSRGHLGPVARAAPPIKANFGQFYVRNTCNASARVIGILIICAALCFCIHLGLAQEDEFCPASWKFENGWKGCCKERELVLAVITPLQKYSKYLPNFSMSLIREIHHFLNF